MIDSSKVAGAIKQIVDVINDVSEGFLAESEEKKPETTEKSEGEISFNSMPVGSLVSVKTKSQHMYLFLKTGVNQWAEYEVTMATGPRIKATAGTTSDWGMNGFKREHTVTVVA